MLEGGRGQRLGRGRIEDGFDAVLLTEFHRSHSRFHRNFQHRHHHIAAGDLFFDLIDKSAVHQLVGRHIQNDAVFAGLVQNNKADAGRHPVGLAQVGGIHPFAGVEIGGDFAQFIAADDAGKVGIGPQPGRTHRLVRAFTARPHIEIGPQQRFAKYRHMAGSNRQPDGKAADDGNDWFGHRLPHF